MQSLVTVTAINLVSKPDIRGLALAVQEHGIVISFHVAHWIGPLLWRLIQVVISELDG